MENWSLKQITAWLNSGGGWKSSWNTGSFESIDYLLKRNWFINDEDVHELLDTADDETFCKIMNNRKNYSTRIRMILMPEDYWLDESLLRLRIQDPNTLPNNRH